MNILDRYVTRYFLLNFVILLTVFFSLFLIGDVMIDLDEYIAAGRNYREDFGGNVTLAATWTILDYNGPIMLLLYVYFCGLVVLGAAGFTFAGFTRSRELLAMVSSGVSMYRIALPVLLVGCLLNVLTLVDQELLLPPLAVKLSRGKGEMKDFDTRRHPVYFAPDGKGALLTAGDFRIIGDEAVLTGVTILVRSASGAAVSRVSADQGRWDPQRVGWVLSGGVIVHRPTTSDLFADVASARMQEIDFFATDLSPTLLLAQRASHLLRILSTTELRAMLDHPRAEVGKIERIIHGRFSLLVMNILVLTMGLPFFLVREPSNLLAQSIKAAGVCIGAWATGLVLQQTALPGLNPVAGAWLPVVIFLPVTAALLQTMRT